MIKFMDEITEAIEQFIAGVGENAVFILGLLAKAFILITTPVWILPYMFIRDMLRDNNGGECESPDCDSCPFPPCQKGEGEQ